MLRKKAILYTGNVLLLIMAAFHGSGVIYVTNLMNDSDAKGFLKDIFPVLFMHPSLHLLILAIFGIVAIKMPQEGYRIFRVLMVAILIDAALGFYLGGIVPGILLTLSAACFLPGATRPNTA
jgi:hypothetical protein